MNEWLNDWMDECKLSKNWAPIVKCHSQNTWTWTSLYIIHVVKLKTNKTVFLCWCFSFFSLVEEQMNEKLVLMISTGTVFRHIKTWQEKNASPLIMSNMVVRYLVYALVKQMHLHGTKQVVAAASPYTATNFNLFRQRCGPCFTLNTDYFAGQSHRPTATCLACCLICYFLSSK